MHTGLLRQELFQLRLPRRLARWYVRIRLAETNRWRPVPNAWGQVYRGGVELRGPTLVQPPPPLDVYHPPLPRPTSNPGLPAGGGRCVGGWGGAREALLTQISGVSPPRAISQVGPTPFGGGPVLSSGPPLAGGGPCGGLCFSISGPSVRASEDRPLLSLRPRPTSKRVLARVRARLKERKRRLTGESNRSGFLRYTHDTLL